MVVGPLAIRQAANVFSDLQTVHYRHAGRFGQDDIPGYALDHRHPKALKTTRWMLGREEDTVDEYIQFWVNPSECHWKVGTRTSMDKTAAGMVHHEGVPLGTPSNGSRYDLPTLAISFQSGIITPNGYRDISVTEDDPAIPPGLGNFYRFIHLLDERNVLDHGTPNYINILCTSPVFGQQGMWLQGFFTEDGVAWMDSAETPNMVNSWGANFVVFSSAPSFNSLRSLWG